MPNVNGVNNQSALALPWLEYFSGIEVMRIVGSGIDSIVTIFQIATLNREWIISTVILMCPNLESREPYYLLRIRGNASC